ncbi:MAG: hypothetical protein WD512_17835 [Candidatus Paceibacterota bacterium]
MQVWKEFANNVILQEMDRRKVSRETLIEELVTITKSTGEYRFRIMSNYCNPENTTYFTATRYNLILPTLLKWNKQNKPSFFKRIINRSAFSLSPMPTQSCEPNAQSPLLTNDYLQLYKDTKR